MCIFCLEQAGFSSFHNLLDHTLGLSALGSFEVTLKSAGLTRVWVLRCTWGKRWTNKRWRVSLLPLSGLSQRSRRYSSTFKEEKKKKRAWNLLYFFIRSITWRASILAELVTSRWANRPFRAFQQRTHSYKIWRFSFHLFVTVWFVLFEMSQKQKREPL